MHLNRTAVAVVLMSLAPVSASLVAAQTVPSSQPAAQTPAPGGEPVPTPIVPTTPTGPLLTRSFTAKTGLLFTAVRPERAVDFDTVIGLLEDAMKASTDPAVRAQAAGWRIFKATEPGPNATVLYVFVVDPAIPGADYGLGRILSDAYPDRIQEIWKLYTGALAGGGSLLNLTPVEKPAPTPATPTIGAPTTATPGGRGAPAGRGATPPRPSPPPQ